MDVASKNITVCNSLVYSGLGNLTGLFISFIITDDYIYSY